MRRKPMIISIATGLVLALLLVWILVIRRDSPCPGFDIVYNGYGKVTCSKDSVRMAPRSATRAKDTHAGLVVADVATTRGKVGAVIQTNEQVRKGEPNPWEVGWFLWRYQDPQHFYAVVLKPNGWEVSKQDPAYPGGQRFLASGKKPTFPLGTKHAVTVVQLEDEANFIILANGRELARVVDDERPYEEGKIGLYSEDADVTFTRIRGATTSFK